MREILFRAKRIDNGEWVEGYYGIKGKGTDIENHYIMVPTFQSSIGNYDYMCYFTDVHIDPETICQYTGLKDKNGNRIWENDIFTEKHKGKVHYAFKVVFNNEYCTFELESNHGSAYNIQLVYKSKLKKEGNVFDNPELLERN